MVINLGLTEEIENRASIHQEEHPSKVILHPGYNRINHNILPLPYDTLVSPWSLREGNKHSKVYTTTSETSGDSESQLPLMTLLNFYSNCYLPGLLVGYFRTISLTVLSRDFYTGKLKKGVDSKAQTHLAQVDEETAHGSVHAVICIAGIWTPHVLHPLGMKRGRKQVTERVKQTFLTAIN